MIQLFQSSVRRIAIVGDNFSNDIIRKYRMGADSYFTGAGLTFYMENGEREEERAIYHPVYQTFHYLFQTLYWRHHTSITCNQVLYQRIARQGLRQSLELLRLSSSSAYKSVQNVIRQMDTIMEQKQLLPYAEQVLQIEMNRFLHGKQKILSKEQNALVERLEELDIVIREMEKRMGDTLPAASFWQLKEREQMKIIRELQNSLPEIRKTIVPSILSKQALFDEQTQNLVREKTEQIQGRLLLELLSSDTELLLQLLMISHASTGFKGEQEEREKLLQQYIREYEAAGRESGDTKGSVELFLQVFQTATEQERADLQKYLYENAGSILRQGYGSLTPEQSTLLQSRYYELQKTELGGQLLEWLAAEPAQILSILERLGEEAQKTEIVKIYQTRKEQELSDFKQNGSDREPAAAELFLDCFYHAEPAAQEEFRNYLYDEVSMVLLKQNSFDDVQPEEKVHAQAGLEEFRNDFSDEESMILLKQNSFDDVQSEETSRTKAALEDQGWTNRVTPDHQLPEMGERLIRWLETAPVHIVELFREIGNDASKTAFYRTYVDRLSEEMKQHIISKQEQVIIFRETYEQAGDQEREEFRKYLRTEAPQILNQKMLLVESERSKDGKGQEPVSQEVLRQAGNQILTWLATEPEQVLDILEKIESYVQKEGILQEYLETVQAMRQTNSFRKEEQVNIFLSKYALADEKQQEEFRTYLYEEVPLLLADQNILREAMGQEVTGKQNEASSVTSTAEWAELKQQLMAYMIQNQEQIVLQVQRLRSENELWKITARTELSGNERNTFVDTGNLENDRSLESNAGNQGNERDSSKDSELLTKSFDIDEVAESNEKRRIDQQVAGNQKNAAGISVIPAGMPAGYETSQYVQDTAESKAAIIIQKELGDQKLCQTETYEQWVDAQIQKLMVHPEVLLRLCEAATQEGTELQLVNEYIRQSERQKNDTWHSQLQVLLQVIENAVPEEKYAFFQYLSLRLVQQTEGEQRTRNYEYVDYADGGVDELQTLHMEQVVNQVLIEDLAHGLEGDISELLFTIYQELVQAERSAEFAYDFRMPGLEKAPDTQLELLYDYFTQESLVFAENALGQEKAGEVKEIREIREVRDQRKREHIEDRELQRKEQRESQGEQQSTELKQQWKVPEREALQRLQRLQREVLESNPSSDSGQSESDGVAGENQAALKGDVLLKWFQTMNREELHGVTELLKQDLYGYPEHEQAADDRRTDSEHVTVREKEFGITEIGNRTDSYLRQLLRLHQISQWMEQANTLIEIIEQQELKPVVRKEISSGIQNRSRIGRQAMAEQEREALIHWTEQQTEQVQLELLHMMRYVVEEDGRGSIQIRDAVWMPEDTPYPPESKGKKTRKRTGKATRKNSMEEAGQNHTEVLVDTVQLREYVVQTLRELPDRFLHRVAAGLTGYMIREQILPPASSRADTVKERKLRILRGMPDLVFTQDEMMEGPRELVISKRHLLSQIEQGSMEELFHLTQLLRKKRMVREAVELYTDKLLLKQYLKTQVLELKSEDMASLEQELRTPSELLADDMLTFLHYQMEESGTQEQNSAVAGVLSQTDQKIGRLDYGIYTEELKESLLTGESMTYHISREQNEEERKRDIVNTVEQIVTTKREEWKEMSKEEEDIHLELNDVTDEMNVIKEELREQNRRMEQIQDLVEKRQPNVSVIYDEVVRKMEQQMNLERQRRGLD